MSLTSQEMEDQILSLQEAVSALSKQVADLTDRLQTRADVLHAQEQWDVPFMHDPLNSPVVWTRGQDTASNEKDTQGILSLVYHVLSSATNAHPWPLYVELITAHKTGDAVNIVTRLRRAGDGWSVAYHAETFHDAGTGDTIGLNVEAWNETPRGVGKSHAINLQSKRFEPDDAPMAEIDNAINIQSDKRARWITGVHFDPHSRGDRAIWIEGTWEVGLDAGDNSIRMNAGAKLCFEKTCRYFMMFNPETNRIEFHNKGDGRDLVIMSLG